MTSGSCCFRNLGNTGEYSPCPFNTINDIDMDLVRGINAGVDPLWDEDSCDYDRCEWVKGLDTDCSTPLKAPPPPPRPTPSKKNSLDDIQSIVSSSKKNNTIKYTIMVVIVILVLGLMYVATRLCILYICDCKKQQQRQRGSTVLEADSSKGNTWSPAHKGDSYLAQLKDRVIDKFRAVEYKITPPRQ